MFRLRCQCCTSHPRFGTKPPGRRRTLPSLSRLPQHFFFFFFFLYTSLTADGPQRARFANPSYGNVAILLMPVVTKDILHLSPVLAYDMFSFYRDASSALFTLRQPMVEYFTYSSRAHAFCHGSQYKRPDFCQESNYLTTSSAHYY